MERSRDELTDKDLAKVSGCEVTVYTFEPIVIRSRPTTTGNGTGSETHDAKLKNQSTKV
jgi:hypothetical protein